MTWIIGSAALFGSAILVSDICVTFTDKDGREQYIDCLQKIYPLGRFVIGGFSGSVSIGFDILGTLQLEFSNAPADAAVDMNVLVHTWLPRVVRRIFRNAPESERRLSSSIILASAHPTKNRGDAPWPATQIHVLSSPDFAPVEAAALETTAIGKGTSVSAYMDAVRALSSDVGFLKASMDNQDGHASLMAHMVSITIEKGPVRGVSSLFQAGVVTRGGWAIHDHEYTAHQSNGRTIKRTFPRIARGREEYEALSHELLSSPQSAQC